jgi:predicted transcriptional regulator
MSAASEPNIKASVREALETLPDDASWDDVMYRLYVRRKIEAGLRDVGEGKTLPVEEVQTALSDWAHER